MASFTDKTSSFALSQLLVDRGIRFDILSMHMHATEQTRATNCVNLLLQLLARVTPIPWFKIQHNTGSIQAKIQNVWILTSGLDPFGERIGWNPKIRAKMQKVSLQDVIYCGGRRIAPIVSQPTPVFARMAAERSCEDQVLRLSEEAVSVNFWILLKLVVCSSTVEIVGSGGG